MKKDWTDYQKMMHYRNQVSELQKDLNRVRMQATLHMNMNKDRKQEYVRIISFLHKLTLEGRITKEETKPYLLKRNKNKSKTFK